MIYVRLDMDHARLDALSAEVRATPARIQRSAMRALDKTAQQLRRGIVRALASDLGTTQKALGGRIKYTKPNPNKLNAYVWTGLNPLLPEQLGRVREKRRPGGGVQAGKHFFPGAFMARIGGSTLAWQRAGKKRLPLMRPTLPIDRLGSLIIEPLADAAQQRLPVVLEQELNFALRI